MLYLADSLQIIYVMHASWPISGGIYYLYLGIVS